MAEKEDAMLQVEREKNQVDFAAYLYRKDGVAKLCVFKYTDGWTDADKDEMLKEAQAAAKKFLKGLSKKAKEKEEPS